MNLKLSQQELELANEKGMIERPVNKGTFEALVYRPEDICKRMLRKDFKTIRNKDIQKAFKTDLFRLLLAFNPFDSVSVNDQRTIYTEVKIIVSEDSKNFQIYLK